MGTINRVPKGLLPLLDAKTLGRTPSESLDVLQPTLELGSFYATDIPYQIGVNFSLVVDAVGSYAPVTVPDGKLWMVYNVGYVFTALAAGGGRVQGWIRFRPSSAAIGVPFGESLQVGTGLQIAGIGESVAKSQTFESPFMAPSGSVFELQNGEAIGNNARADVYVLYRELSV